MVVGSPNCHSAPACAKSMNWNTGCHSRVVPTGHTVPVRDCPCLARYLPKRRRWCETAVASFGSWSFSFQSTRSKDAFSPFHQYRPDPPRMPASRFASGSKLNIRWTRIQVMGPEDDFGWAAPTAPAQVRGGRRAGKRQGLADTGIAHWSGGHRPQRLPSTHLARTALRAYFKQSPPSYRRRLIELRYPVQVQGIPDGVIDEVAEELRYEKAGAEVFLNAIKKQIFVDGGANPTGDVCAGQHFHGYVGMEKVAVDNVLVGSRIPRAEITSKQKVPQCGALTLCPCNLYVSA